MKGIVLAGGLGTRLYPITKLVNKHLLPLYDRPMYYWPLQTLIDSGITQIVVVSGPPHGDQIKESLKYFPKKENIRLTFVYQQKPLGIPDAIYKCKKFIGVDSFTMLVGDNLFSGNFKKEVQKFNGGAVAVIRKVKDPQRFGVVKFDRKNRIETIVEKPQKFISSWAVGAPYIFDNSAFEKIKKLVPSKRGEFEIVDLLKLYIKDNNLRFYKKSGVWIDAGTPESLLKANTIAKKMAAESLYIFKP